MEIKTQILKPVKRRNVVDVPFSERAMKNFQT